jgi:hypothetical protein
MVEFKFTAQKINGQSISGSLAANTVAEGKKNSSPCRKKSVKNKFDREKDNLYL